MYNYNPYQYGQPMIPQNISPQNFMQPKPMVAPTQPIQTIEKKQQEASCYFVKSIDDFKVDVLPGIYYLGINADNKEIYVRKINDDGNVGLETYKLAIEKREKTELQNIDERLSNIERQLGIKEKEDAAIRPTETTGI